jgi:hypothetical protein
MTHLKWVLHDGGGGCCRIQGQRWRLRSTVYAIASGLPYAEVHRVLSERTAGKSESSTCGTIESVLGFW